MPLFFIAVAVVICVPLVPFSNFYLLLSHLVNISWLCLFQEEVLLLRTLVNPNHGHNSKIHTCSYFSRGASFLSRDAATKRVLTDDNAPHYFYQPFYTYHTSACRVFITRFFMGFCSRCKQVVSNPYCVLLFLLGIHILYSCCCGARGSGRKMGKEKRRSTSARYLRSFR